MAAFIKFSGSDYGGPNSAISFFGVSGTMLQLRFSRSQFGRTCWVVDMEFGEWVCTCEGFCGGFGGFFFIVKTLKFALNPKKWFPQRSTNQPPYLKDKPMWARFEGGIFCGTSFSGYGFCEGLFGILPQWFSVVAWSTSTGKQAKHIWVSNSQEHQFRNSQCPYYS